MELPLFCAFPATVFQGHTVRVTVYNTMVKYTGIIRTIMSKDTISYYGQFYARFRRQCHMFIGNTLIGLLSLSIQARHQVDIVSPQLVLYGPLLDIEPTHGWNYRHKINVV